MTPKPPSAPVCPVLLYHKIDRPGPQSLIRGSFTPPRRFARQMTHLQRKGFTFLTAAELVEHFVSHGEFPQRSVAVTFDDGWRDNYVNGFPVLQSLGIRATVFLVAGEVGKVSFRAVTKGEPARAYLRREQILEMDRYGIEFGSHTLSHQLLDRIPEAEALAEVTQAKQRIEDLLGKECRTFAYPAGFFNPAVQSIVREAGHAAAFSTVYGPRDRVDLMALNRIEILRRHRLRFQQRRRNAPLLCRNSP